MQPRQRIRWHELLWPVEHSAQGLVAPDCVCYPARRLAHVVLNNGGSKRTRRRAHPRGTPCLQSSTLREMLLVPREGTGVENSSVPQFRATRRSYSSGLPFAVACEWGSSECVGVRASPRKRRVRLGGDLHGPRDRGHYWEVASHGSPKSISRPLARVVPSHKDATAAGPFGLSTNRRRLRPTTPSTEGSIRR